MTLQELDTFGKTLDPEVQDPLFNTHGKPHRNISFTGEYRFRHIIPHLIHSNFLDNSSNAALDQSSFLVRQYRHLLDDFGHLSTDEIRGYDSYKDFRTETDFNKRRIRLTSAALLQQGCNVEKLVRWIGGPHLASHRNTKRILENLKPSVTPSVLAEVKRIFTYGAPKVCNAQNTEENLLKYYNYGNHSSVDDNPDIYKKVLVKDSRRGNTILVDDRLFAYIPNTHLTPQGIASLDDKWKNERPIFDSSHRPDLNSFAINDWTSKLTEPELEFPGSLLRFLVWMYNLRITYPNRAIYLGDNDVTNAFKLVKNNPGIVPMCGFRASGLLGFATGQTFGNCYSPANFEPAAIARQQHAKYLWTHKKDEVLRRADRYVKDLVLTKDPSDIRPFAQAEKDELNPGVLNDDFSRKPPETPMQVDDCLLADVEEYFPRTVAASIVALEDVFDGNHPYQEAPLSEEKLNPIHSEQRLLTGHVPDSRSMTVKISPRRKEKVMNYLKSEGWLDLTKTKRANIKEIATVPGLIGSAGEFFPWAKAQLLLINGLLCTCIKTAYNNARAMNRISKRADQAHRTMPAQMSYRLKFIKEKWQAEYIWRNKHRVLISIDIIRCCILVYKYLESGAPWERPIGHIVPRTPSFVSTGDACLKAIAVQIPRLQVWCLLPFSEELCARISRKEIHINVLEFIALLISFIIVQEKVKLHPEMYPPAPVLLAFGDNTSANAWWKKMSTHSQMGKNVLKLYAEYQLLSPVCSVSEHIKGSDNVIADTISRPHELFTPHLTHVWKTPYHKLIQQVCLRYEEKKLWEVFLPSAELLSALNLALSSDCSWERPKKPKNNGRFVHVGRTFYGGQPCGESTTTCFL